MFKRLPIGHESILGGRGAPPISYMSHRIRSGPALSLLRRSQVTWPALRHFHRWSCHSVISADTGSPRVDTSRSSRRRGRGRWTRDPATVLPVPQTRETLVEESMKRRDSEGRMSLGTLPHEPSTTKSGRVDCASYHRPRPGQPLDQSVEEASNKYTKRGEGQLEVGSRSA